jgi:hypothetical protein
MDDHTLEWLVEWLRERIAAMRPGERTLNLKLCKAGAKKLLHDLEESMELCFMATYSKDGPRGPIHAARKRARAAALAYPQGPACSQ